jgi:GNAT superfamily N-acetyltransferase
MSHVDRTLRALWFRALGAICYRRVEIREFILDQTHDDDQTVAALTLDQLNPADIEQYNAFRRPSDPDSALRRMRDGHCCFIARDGERIVGASWGATANARNSYLSAPIALTSDEAYAYDLFTAPDWRRKGVAVAVTKALHDFYRDEGKWRVLRFVVPENHAAMAGTLGYDSIGRTGFVCIGRFRVNFCRMKAGKLAPGKSRA